VKNRRLRARVYAGCLGYTVTHYQFQFSVFHVRVTDRLETQTFDFVDQPFGSPFNTV